MLSESDAQNKRREENFQKRFSRRGGSFAKTQMRLGEDKMDKRSRDYFVSRCMAKQRAQYMNRTVK